jgi:hypothetical protein
VLKRVKDALMGSGCGFAKIKFHKNQIFVLILVWGHHVVHIPAMAASPHKLPLSRLPSGSVRLASSPAASCCCLSTDIAYYYHGIFTN